MPDKKESDPHWWTKAIAFLCATPFFCLDVLLYSFSLAWLRRTVLFVFNGRQQRQLKMQSVAVGSATDSQGAPRRSVLSPERLLDGDVPACTVYAMVQSAVQTHGSAPALVSRRFVELKKVHESDRFPSKIFDDSSFNESTYRSFGEQLLHFGAGLRGLKMEPIPSLQSDQSLDNVSTGSSVVVIFEDTCWQWTVALHGALSQSLTVATCYSTLGEEAVLSAVNETGATTLMLNWKKAAKFAKLSDQMPSLRTIIASTHEMPVETSKSDIFTLPNDNDDDSTTAPKTKVRILTSDQVMAMGAEQRTDFPPVPPQPTDVAVIMYTSGSTGNPKGVVMKHSQMVAGVFGMAKNVDLQVGKEVFVSYLPLAHILALQIEIYMLYAGAKLCYADARELPKALTIYQPTVFAGVPKVWDVIKHGLDQKLAKTAGPLVKRILDVLIQWKIFVLHRGFDTPFSNLVFKAIAKKVFGRVLRFGVAGGGPLSASLHDYCRAVFACPIIQGYALTETCVGGCFQALDDDRSGIVGPPVPSVEICLQSEPDIKDSGGLSYLHTDSKDINGQTVIGRGEICMRGPCISSGYYKLPDQTKEVYDDDGWFHTGDIGQFTEDGVIQIIDRKKNLVKLKGGEYVAIESMENAFTASEFCHAVCVIATGDMDVPLVCVSANVSSLEDWASQNNVSYDSVSDLCEMDETRKAVVQSMIAAGKEAGLTSLELRIKDCCVVTKEWGPGHGMTATMKIDRKQICNIHEQEIQAMMKRNGVESS